MGLTHIKLFRSIRIFLALRYQKSQAIAVMKDWYAEDLSGPDLDLQEVLQQVELSQKQRQRASWATPARWLAKLTEPRCKAIQNTDQAAYDLDDDSVD